VQDATKQFASNKPGLDYELMLATVPVVEGVRVMDVMRALDAAHIDAVDLIRREATLDDVFLALTSPTNEKNETEEVRA
jgi:hypothetical protein